MKRAKIQVEMRIVSLALLSIAFLSIRVTTAFADCSTDVGPVDHRSPLEVVQAIAAAADCVVETNVKEIRECHNYSRLVFEKAKGVGSAVSSVKVAWIFAKSGTLLDRNGKDTNLSHHTVAVLRVVGDPSDYVVDLTEKPPIFHQSIDSWVKARFQNGGVRFVADEDIGGLRNKWWDPLEKGGAFR
ncbi:MAG: hypothetical protein V1495_09775 [Pseudomonadota bacterium]